MTRRLPLTANGIAILRMHHAGIPHDRIAFLGEHRGAWSAGDVERVVADWGHPDRETAHGDFRDHGGPDAYPREHGTKRGYYQHRKHGEIQCDACLGSRRVGGAA